MKYSQLLTAIDSTHLSPEQLAPALGVSNMTLRRWRKASSRATIPKGYQRSVVEGIYQLVIDGKLSLESPEVQSLLRDAPSLSFDAIIKQLGVSVDILNSSGTHDEKSHFDSLPDRDQSKTYRRSGREHEEAQHLSENGRRMEKANFGLNESDPLGPAFDHRQACSLRSAFLSDHSRSISFQTTSPCSDCLMTMPFSVSRWLTT